MSFSRTVSFFKTATLFNILIGVQTFYVSVSFGGGRHLLRPGFERRSNPLDVAPFLHQGWSVPTFSSTTTLQMRKSRKGNSNAVGKRVKKENLPCKICVVCNRPFTWRKKWERNWEEVTTCSKSCNAKRRAKKKQGQGDASTATSMGKNSHPRLGHVTDDPYSSDDDEYSIGEESLPSKGQKQKDKKAARCAKRMG